MFVYLVLCNGEWLVTLEGNSARGGYYAAVRTARDERSMRRGTFEVVFNGRVVYVID